MTIKIQIRRGTSTQWTTSNPTLAAGEVGYESNTQKIKIGDGTTAWTSLSYFPDSSVIKFTPVGSLSSTTVAAALAELDGDIATLTASVTAKQDSAFTPSGSIAASTISGAIVELDQEKLPKAAAFGGQVSGTYSSLTVADTHGSSGVLTHHAQSHTHALAADGTVSHASLSNVTADQHHAQSHTHNGDSSGTVAHSSLSGLDTDSGTASLHHTLGTSAFQASAGNHTHPIYRSTLYTTSDQTITSSTTLTTSTPLGIPVSANAVVSINYVLPIVAGAGGFKLGWTVPSGATLTWSSISNNGTTSSFTASSTTTTGTSLTVASSTLVQWVQVRGYYTGGASAGTISFQFAQNASSTTGTVLKKGAYLSYVAQ